MEDPDRPLAEATGPDTEVVVVATEAVATKVATEEAGAVVGTKAEEEEVGAARPTGAVMAAEAKAVEEATVVVRDKVRGKGNPYGFQMRVKPVLVIIPFIALVLWKMSRRNFLTPRTFLVP